LFENGVDVNARGRFNISALCAASRAANEVMVRLLLENGADVDANGGTHGYALQAASAKGHVAVVRFLLHKGANVNAEVSGAALCTLLRAQGMKR
jgi:ankyrin repeat protein